MLVDTQSYELAMHFLQDEPFDTDQNRQALAEEIQRAIEDWLEDKE